MSEQNQSIYENSNYPSRQTPTPEGDPQEPKKGKHPRLGMVGKVLGTLLLIGLCTGVIMCCFLAVYIKTVIVPYADLSLDDFQLGENSIGDDDGLDIDRQETAHDDSGAETDEQQGAQHLAEHAQTGVSPLLGLLGVPLRRGGLPGGIVAVFVNRSILFRHVVTSNRAQKKMRSPTVSAA